MISIWSPRPLHGAFTAGCFDDDSPTIQEVIVTTLWSVRETAPCSATTLGRLRRQLLEERRVQLERAEVLAGDAGADAAGTVEWELAPRLVASARQTVYDIDEALARMDVGAYGWCLVCGSRLAIACLRAIPHARLCVACQTRTSAAAS